MDDPDRIGPVEAYAVAGAWESKRSRRFALYTKDGTPHRHSGIRTGQLRTHPDPSPTISDDLLGIHGPVLFAGFAPQQFGHVVINSLGRLWALDDLPPDTRLLFLSKKVRAVRLSRYLHSLLEMLGIENEVVLTDRSHFLPEAYLARDIFGEAYGGRGLTQFYDWIDRRLPPPGPVEHGKSIYVSRVRLGASMGRFACEEHLQRLLKANGYEVFAPEQHDLATQARTYQTASRLIFAEGSALHFYALFARPGQNVAVIQRREQLPPLIEVQLGDRPSRKITQINAIRDVFWPPVPGDHYSVSTLDFGLLRRALVKNGFLHGNAKWSVPGPDSVAASLKAGLRAGEALLDAAGRAAYLERRRARRAGAT